jgi:hypothetical protein
MRLHFRSRRAFPFDGIRVHRGFVVAPVQVEVAWHFQFASVQTGEL